MIDRFADFIRLYTQNHTEVKLLGKNVGNGWEYREQLDAAGQNEPAALLGGQLY